MTTARVPLLVAVVAAALAAGCSSSTSHPRPAPGSSARSERTCGSQPDLFRGKTVAMVTVTGHKPLAHGVHVTYVELRGRVVRSDHLAAGSSVTWVQTNSVVTRSRDDSVPDGSRAVVLLTAPSARRFATETFAEVTGRIAAFGVVDANVRAQLRTASLDAVYAFLASCVRSS